MVKDINEGVSEFRKNKKAVLLDVRTEEEYKERHIQDSINVPVASLGQIRGKVEDLSTPLYVYCHSGVRSAIAVEELTEMGYSKVRDIGGINRYKGN